ncbi:MAG: hypothetical protein H0V44_14260 [Planctomycetes bacterium]|nr:hypothetical protein [Planctomycetota bacterium]
MLVIAKVLASVVVLQLTWALVRWLILPGPTRAAVETLAARLGLAVRCGEPLQDALLSLQPLLPWPAPWRLRRVARGLTDGSGIGAVEQLVQERLLPKDLRAGGMAAEAAGADTLASWFDGLSGRPHHQETPTYGIRAVACALLSLGVIQFLLIFIAPKFEQIARELGLSPTGAFAGFIALGRWYHAHQVVAWVCLALAVWLGIIVWRRCVWWGRSRLDRGTVILAATAAGVDEMTISRHLGGSLAAGSQLGARLAAAGAAGDFAGLCRASGWSAADSASLAAAIDRARWRRHHLARVAVLVASVALPLLVAVPVWWFSAGIFGMLVDMMTILLEST